MLRLLEIGAIIFIVVYGIIKLMGMFSDFKIKRQKATALKKLEEQAKKVAKEKEDILSETQKTTETINKINDTLNN